MLILNSNRLQHAGSPARPEPGLVMVLLVVLLLAMNVPETLAGTKSSPATPAAAPPARQQIAVQVPEQFRYGVFAEQRALTAPAGFQVSVFAAGLGKARLMTLGPQGDIYLTDSGGGRVWLLPDRNHDGVADRRIVFADGLHLPHGLLFRDNELLVAEEGRVIALTDTDGDFQADAKRVLSDDIPSGGGHSTRTLVQDHDGTLLLSAGSSCNACVEDDPRRAAVLRLPARGGKATLFAGGLRNSVGLAFQPLTGELWGVDNGRDNLGDDIPPEELNRIVQGGDYGWPYCYAQRIPDPEFGGRQRCAETRPPIVELQAHSAPLGIAFGQGLAFPKIYQDMLFVAFHGSWNRSEPTGYKLVGIPFKDGQPAGQPLDIITGWHQPAKPGGALVGIMSRFAGDADPWGRPVAPLVGADGALYLSDDKAGAVYRIICKGDAPPH